jgi:hypothetical protein
MLEMALIIAFLLLACLASIASANAKLTLIASLLSRMSDHQEAVWPRPPKMPQYLKEP